MASHFQITKSLTKTNISILKVYLIFLRNVPNDINKFFVYHSQQRGVVRKKVWNPVLEIRAMNQTLSTILLLYRGRYKITHLINWHYYFPFVIFWLKLVLVCIITLHNSFSRIPYYLLLLEHIYYVLAIFSW